MLTLLSIAGFDPSGGAGVLADVDDGSRDAAGHFLGYRLAIAGQAATNQGVIQIYSVDTIHCFKHRVTEFLSDHDQQFTTTCIIIYDEYGCRP